MIETDALLEAQAIMTRFAAETGIPPAATRPPIRYLWTDAFAVCNFLGLYRTAGDPSHRQLAVNLIDQVHHVLGRHREDDTREGWISGLSHRNGEDHPTAGGLRIGKKLNERGPSAPFDEPLEWNRDGQYFHYLTKWMHALDRAARLLGQNQYGRWASELAKTAYTRFVYSAANGLERRMVWKMSIDLSYPLVKAMGHHDPLDGFITFMQIDSNPSRKTEKGGWPDLETEIAELADICAGKNWATDDPLGIGGLLCDGFRLAQLTARGDFLGNGLLEAVLEASLQGLKVYTKSSPTKRPAEQRLAFRELGLSTGLHALAKTERLLVHESQLPLKTRRLQGLVNRLMKYAPLAGETEEFWLDPAHQETPVWMEHLDINRVMLATSLAPDGYVDI